MKNLDGKLAVVTGSSQGIGRAVAILLAKEKCRVILLARSEGALDLVASAITQSEGLATPMVCDVGDQDQVETVFKKIDREFGSVDILINCAGVGSFKKFDAHSGDECNDALQVPALATIYACRAVAGSMKQAGSGSIINILSPASYFPLPYMAPYTASRWALNGFSQSLHHELKSEGVHVGCVCPGRVNTDYLEHNDADMDWWPRISSVFPVVSSESVARKVLNNIKGRKKETIFPLLLWIFVRSYQLFPSLVIWLLESLRLFQPPKILNQVQEVSNKNATNWEESIALEPTVVSYPKSTDDIIQIVTNPRQYPSPVRTAGSRHSTTHCAVSDGGTLMVMRKMDKIISIDRDAMTVTTEPGALYLDVAKKLEERWLQFYVNVEIGNLTMGSAACTGTKDASFPGENGQICSYLKSAKLVKADGSIVVVDDSDPELLQAVRSSYGLFGTLIEVCFQIKPMVAMVVSHRSYTLDQFERELPNIQSSGKSVMYYLFPFSNTITVEYRHYDKSNPPEGRKAWFVRNLAWKTIAPAVSAIVTRGIKHKPSRYFLIDGFYRILQFLLNTIVKSQASFPADQIIRYPERKGLSKYTFSIWAFPEENIATTMRAYYQFCQDYYKQNGYRCDMLNVGYRIEQDQNPIFSYSYDGPVMTLDPVCTASESGWDDFLLAYNEFCHEHNGVPLFNQSKWLSRDNVSKAFGSRIAAFTRLRKKLDPDNRFLNQYFRDLFEPSERDDKSSVDIDETDSRPSKSGPAQLVG